MCYVASAGYMYQTALSALQAREHSSDSVPICVVFLSRGDGDEDEALLFGKALQRRGVEFLRLDMDALGGLPPIFGRYFVAPVLPERITRILYLDGDTQILSSLDPLLAVSPPRSGVVAGRDPMVLLREIDRRQRAKIDGWWDRSDIPPRVRSRYVNSGVFMVDRGFLPQLSREVMTHVKARPRLVFADQDALNVVVDEQISLMPTRWNFPGFLLGTPAETICRPVVVHFMSQPRPWHAPLRPWGSRFYAPYGRLAAEEPDLAPYWQRFGRATTGRYIAQQAYKEITERRALFGGRAAAAMQTLEDSVDLSVGT